MSTSTTTTTTGGTYTTGYASTSNFYTPYNDFQKIVEEVLEKVYQLGFEHGGSAMKRLLNGSDKDAKDKKKFDEFVSRIISIISQLQADLAAKQAEEYKKNPNWQPGINDYTWRYDQTDPNKFYTSGGSGGGTYTTLGGGGGAGGSSTFIANPTAPTEYYETFNKYRDKIANEFKAYEKLEDEKAR